jgi:riboflavin kinase/FMN adenylyltransferase
MGFPTANIRPSERRKIIPKNGIYAVKARLEETLYGGMMSIGIRPTFKGSHRTLEVNMFDYDAPAYGKTIEIMFVKRIRDELKFDSVQDLIAEMEKDETRARSILEGL